MNAPILRLGVPRSGVLAALLAAATALGCSASADDAPATNLILISIDTLRADRLGCYGATRATSPALDAFAAAGVRFERAIAAAPWTLPSHVSLLSGLAASTHGVDLPDLRPGAETELLAETLRAAGYYTFAHTDGGWLSADFDLDRGFLAFDERDRDIEVAVDALLTDIRKVHGERPFFAFLHTFDVHCPYAPGPPYDAMFASAEARTIATEGRCGNPHFNELDLTDGEVRHLLDQYDGGVRRVDDALGRLFAALEAEGVLDDTLVVVTSDHGEEFREHGRIGHEESVFPELLHVPLLIRGPGIASRVISEPVGLIDVSPTMLDLLGIEPPADLDGTSLRGMLEGGSPAAARPVRSDLRWKRELTAWIDGSTQIIVAPDAVVRFDLATDPRAARGESLDPALAAPVLERLENATPNAAPRRALEALPGAETRDALQRLGYTGD